MFTTRWRCNNSLRLTMLYVTLDLLCAAKRFSEGCVLVAYQRT